MRVNLCARRPYAPRDFAGHYIPKPHCVCARSATANGGAHQASPTRGPEEAKMLNGPQHLRKGAAKRCALCDGKFGLIRHYSWRTALCSKKCVDRFKARQEGDRRWLRRLQAA